MASTETNDTKARHSVDGRHQGLQGWMKSAVDAAILKILMAAVPSTFIGRLQMTLPSGQSVLLGAPADGAVTQLTFTTYAAFCACLWRGALGLAEGIISGGIRTDNLQNLFAFFIDNRAALTSAGRKLPRIVWLDRRLHRQRANTRAGSRSNIAAHYDLGNDFYGLWLDSSMTYSSALYTSADRTLEAAQAAKYAAILAALDLRDGHSVLEIGCGWGGFAEMAAKRGASVDAITISQQQFDAATARLQVLDGAGSARVHFEDYRDTRGQFDRVASIEMIEAVGEDHWPTYFGVIADRLKPGGCAVLQAITIRDDLYDLYRRRPDFIQHYIFPGGMLPTTSLMRQHTEAAGLTFECVQTFGRSYARTLVDWRARFDEARTQIDALGFDDRFRRMWHYYLAYCEVGFERGTVDVGLYRLSKPADGSQGHRQ